MSFKTSHLLLRGCLRPLGTARHQVPSSGSATPLSHWLAEEAPQEQSRPTLGTKAGEHTPWLVDRTDYLKKIDFKKSCFP